MTVDIRIGNCLDVLRAAYLRERMPGETAEQWTVRTGRDTGYLERKAKAS